MGNVFTLSRLGSGHVSKHFGIGGVTHNATDVTDFLGRNQFLNWEMRKNSIKSEREKELKESNKKQWNIAISNESNIFQSLI